MKYIFDASIRRRSNLVSDVDALVCVFDEIEASTAEDVRVAEVASQRFARFYKFKLSSHPDSTAAKYLHIVLPDSARPY